MNRYFYAFLLAFTFSAIPTWLKRIQLERLKRLYYCFKKRNNLQDTAITITAITGADLEVNKLKTLKIFSLQYQH